MKVFKAWRFKCDFCGCNKRQRKAMQRHEATCTMNPDRSCRLHVYATGNDNAPPMPAILVELGAHYRDVDRGLAALREFVGNCPACILAALRQSGLCKGTADEDGYSDAPIGKEQFDFKKELAGVWANHNDAVASARYDY